MAATGVDARLGRRLVLDEIFDLSLYHALREIAPASMRPIFDALIPIETRHVAFWQEFFGLKDVTTLDAGRRLKLALIIAVCRLFGAPAIHVVLEAIEVLGAVSGFFAAFNSSVAVVAAGFTVGVAGALSMAAGAYIGAGSEAELRETEDARKRFLGEPVTSEAGQRPLVAAAIVGIGYLVGAVVPVLPVLFGARNVLPTVLTGGVMIVAVSAIVAFISGMDVRRRIVLNVIITGIAVVVTYALGLLTKKLLGVEI